MSETTTIQIATDTRDELRSIGKMGDNYDKVIRQLIKEHKEHKYKLKIDKHAKEADEFIKEHRDEFVSIDEL
jgi:predicted CopG family antitoxin